MTRSLSDPAPLGRAAAVVGDGGDVANEGDFETGCLERAESALSPRARTFDEHRHRAHAVLHRAAGRFFSSQLSGEGRALARTLEAARARRRPGHGGAVDVGDGDDGVVERRLDVSDAGGDVLADLFLLLRAFARGRRGAGTGGRGLGHDDRSALARGGGGGGPPRQHPLAGTLARAGVGVGALPVHGQALAVPEAAVAAEIHEALDVHLHFAPEIAFDLELRFDRFAKGFDVGVGQLFDLLVQRDAGFFADDAGIGFADAVDVRQGKGHVLTTGKIDSSDACHVETSTLPLLVAGIFANDPHDAFAANHFALVADLLDARSNLHSSSYLCL